MKKFRYSCLAAALVACVGSPARADFFEDFESYTNNLSLPVPWVNNHRITPSSVDMLVTPDPSGLNLIGQGPSGQGGGADWSESDRVTNFDSSELEFELQWKARLLAREGAMPRLGLGLFDGTGAHFVLFEMDGLSNTIKTTVSGTGEVNTISVLRDVWYRLTVNLQDDGAGNSIFFTTLEQESGGSFSSVGTLGGGSLPATFSPVWVHLASIFADPEGPTSSEINAMDDISFVSGAPPVSENVEATDVEVADTMAAEFQSDVDVLFWLQSTPDLIDTNTWQDTGAQTTGDGNTMKLFDPDGFSTSKLYRVVKEE